jgi:acyl carrier protein
MRLDLIELVMIVQGVFDLGFPDDSLGQIQTVGDFQGVSIS